MVKKILVAEDEKPVANALCFKLHAAGFDTLLAYDGESAIAIIRETVVDLIILDLIMPKKDGFFVLEELRKLNSLIPVIVSSNLSQVEDIERAKALGARDYFVKSNVTLVQIVEKVKAIVA